MATIIHPPATDPMRRLLERIAALEKRVSDLERSKAGRG